MKGTYILFMDSRKDLMLEIGKLGIHNLPAGLYAYVGSAMGGSVNLESRVEHHRKLAEEKKGKRQWHIDYFTASPGVEITGSVKIKGRGLECEAAELMRKSGGTEVVKGFGSSDCGCNAHFFWVTEKIAESFLRSLPDIF